MRKYLKISIDFLASCLFLLFLNIMKILGVDNASSFCGSLMRIVGKWTRTGKIVRNNLIYTGYTKSQIENLEPKIWENFGRYIGEFAFIEENYLKTSKRVEIRGLENIQNLHEDNNKKYIIFSGHFANWDFILYSLLGVAGGAGIVYRKINNSFIDRYVRQKRSFLGAEMIEKGPYGARDLIKIVKQKKNLMMLVDQKMNEGIDVPFMNKPSKTPEAPAVIARQYEYALVPVRISRKKGANFILEFYTPFNIEKTDDKAQDVFMAMERINQIISGWIIEKPEDWFWMHQRWGKPHEMK
jgi:KDO2-lipid IV(A) lauroyltransferase